MGRPGDERLRFEVRVTGGARAALGVGLEGVGGGGEDRGLLTAFGVQHRQRPERHRLARRLEQDSGFVELVTHHPVHDRLHLPAVTAAACSKGASSACARLAQCVWSVVPTPTFTIARAITSAPSHVRALVTGDHRNGSSPAGGLLAPLDRTSTPAHHPPWPVLSRARHPAWWTSRSPAPGARAAPG